MSGLFRAEESRRVGRAAQTLLAASGGQPFDPEDEGEVETFADVLQRISRSLNTQTAPHRGTPPPTRNIPTAAANRAPALFPPIPSSSLSDAVPPTSVLASSALDYNNNPWPFPSSTSGADDLSLSFFQELDLSVPGVDPSLDYWTMYGQGAAPVGGAEYSMPLAAAGVSAPVEGGWPRQDGAMDGAANGGGAQLSSLLDQLGGGW